MGLLPSSKEYLMDAMKVIKKNGIMHYHGTAKENEWKQLFDDVKTAAELYGFEVELLKKTKVKSYAPKIYHWVLDCRIF
jgi:tRNA G37 N-methylase Trm5